MAAPAAGPIGPTARELRASICVQRRSLAQDAYGGVKGAWATIIPQRAAKLVAVKPSRRGGDEVVIAARVQGTAIWDCWVRWDSLTSTVTAEDRVVDRRGGQDAAGNWLRVFDVAWSHDMDHRRVWILMQLREGRAEG